MTEQPRTSNAEQDIRMTPEHSRLLLQGVGQLLIRGHSGGVSQGTGFLITSPYDNDPYVVTARHVVNTSWSAQSRTLRLLVGDSPRTINLTTAYYPQDEDSDIDVDVAVVKIDPRHKELVSGQTLQFITNDELQSFAPRDAVNVLCAGYPSSYDGDLGVYRIEPKTTYRDALRVFPGMSGGPLLLQWGNEMKVLSIFTHGDPVKGGFAPQGQPQEVQSILDNLLQTAHVAERGA